MKISNELYVSFNKKPALRKAIDFLNSQLASKTWNPSDRLPSIAVLSEICGVSPVSMRRALHFLQHQGKITIVRGGYITVTPTHTDIRSAVDLAHLPLQWAGRADGTRLQSSFVEEHTIRVLPIGEDIGCSGLQIPSGVGEALLAQLGDQALQLST